MVPDMRLRLQAVLSAIANIAPAIDPEDKLAVDQVRVVTGTLQLLIQQCDYSLPFSIHELDITVRLMEDLSSFRDSSREIDEMLQASGEMLALAKQACSLRVPSVASIANMNMSLKAAADTVVNAVLADGDQDAVRRLKRVILDRAADQIRAERTWVRFAGFDAENPDLPDLASLLERA